MTTSLAQRFQEIYGAAPRVYSAPGRVNLIGEHTDYNDGFVMPCALERKTSAAISTREDHKLIVRSEDFSETFEFNLDHLPAARTGAWCDYVLGVVVVLKQMDCPLKGANLLFRSDVPIGAGLSSSAAIEVATAVAVMRENGIHLPMPEVAKLCQKAENTFVGAKVGIMDQFVACLGKADHALMLDCRSLEFTLVPLPGSVQLVICNTMVKHALASGEYNKRRAECEEGVKILSQWLPGIRALRDVTVAELEHRRGDLPATVYKRCEHVVRENARVQHGAKALSEGAFKRFGKLMAESHTSLRDLYEVSSPELDTMVEAAQGLPGFWGGRMTGGGFGGCTVNLVNTTDVKAFAEQIAKRYQEKTATKPDVYICAAGDGAAAGAS